MKNESDGKRMRGGFVVLTVEEMKQVREGHDYYSGTDMSGSGSGIGSGSGPCGSGSGATWWDDIWHSDLKPQKDACFGKQVGDGCAWNNSGASYSGTCNCDYVTKYLLCAGISTSGASSGTGALTAREAACLGKQPNDRCSFIGDGGLTLSGRCDKNIESSSCIYNRIVFGAPGTGKSYKIKEDVKVIQNLGGDFERVTFHPDYSLDRCQ